MLYIMDNYLQKLVDGEGGLLVVEVLLNGNGITHLPGVNKNLYEKCVECRGEYFEKR